jgi:hypothetical protein
VVLPKGYEPYLLVSTKGKRTGLHSPRQHVAE